jgi:hypothetical protein
MPLSKPNWEYWTNMPAAPCWELVAISLNVCPKQRGNVALYDRFQLALGMREFERTAREFHDRLEIAVAHIRSGTLSANINGQYAYCDVPTGDFATWAQERGWALPPELARLGLEQEAASAERRDVEAPPGHDGVHPRTRNNYLRLIHGLALTLIGYDPKHPFAAAKVIREATRVSLDEKTIAGYVQDAHELARADMERDDDA